MVQEVDKILAYDKHVQIFKSVDEIGKTSGNVLSLIDTNLVNYTELSPSFSNLEFLTIRFCSLFEFPLEVTNLKALKFIDLSFNHISELPFEIGHLVNLEQLNCSSNRITSIPSSLGRLKNLKVLEFSNNNITHLPSNFGFLQKLQLFDVSFNMLTHIPDRIPLSRSLQVLRAKQNSLQTITDALKHCFNLVECDFSANLLKDIPSWLVTLPNLKTLYINENRISCFNLEGIETTLQLETLQLQRNMLTIHKRVNFKMFFNLKVLTLGNYERLHSTYNEMKGWNDSLLDLVHLEYLDCCGVGLRALPEKFNKLAKLQWLDLSFNELSSLPSNICCLKNLKHLNLSDNAIANLPEEFGHLNSIEKLILHHNYLMDLPASFESLKDLNFCDISHNEFSKVPNELQHLPSIQYLDLYKNCFEISLNDFPSHLMTAILRSAGWKLLKEDEQVLSKKDENIISFNNEDIDRSQIVAPFEEVFSEKYENLSTSDIEACESMDKETVWENSSLEGDGLRDRVSERTQSTYEWDDEDTNTESTKFPADLHVSTQSLRAGTYQKLLDNYTDDMFEDAELP